MKAALQNGPASIAVAAGNDCWRFYESGVLTEDNNCPTALDHGVVVVGLHAADGNDPDTDTDSGSDSDPDSSDSDADNEDFDEETHMHRRCKKATA